MTEPTATDATAVPFAEARPPHLPDTVTRVPWLIWPFIALALVLVVGAWRDWVAQGSNPDFLVATARNAVPDLAAVLLGAAFFWRHPDGVRRLPLISFAVVLFAVYATLGLLGGQLSGFFESVTPADVATPYLVPLEFAYALFTAAIGIFAILYLARGLGAARRTMDEGSMRGLAILLILVVATYAVLGTASVVTSDFDSAPLSIAIFVLGFGSAVLTLLAWSFLIVVALAGWLGGEEPRVGWLLAVAAGVAALLTQVIIAVAQVALPVVSPAWDGVLLSQATSLLYQLGWVALLAAFVVGLPSTAETVWTDLDGDDDAAVADAAVESTALPEAPLAEPGA